MNTPANDANLRAYVGAHHAGREPDGPSRRGGRPRLPTRSGQAPSS